MFRKKRISMAFKMGKREHRYGRMIGWFSVLQIFTYMVLKTWPAMPFIEMLFEFLMCCVLVSWVGYIISHTLEKKLFGKHGPRSGWKK